MSRNYSAEIGYLLENYSPRFAKLSASLRYLTKKNTLFQWESENMQATEIIKQEIKSTPDFRYYSPPKPLVLQTDASFKGFVAILLLGGHPM